MAMYLAYKIFVIHFYYLTAQRTSKRNTENHVVCFSPSLCTTGKHKIRGQF